jgi:hypothetical protein
VPSIVTDSVMNEELARKRDRHRFAEIVRVKHDRVGNLIYICCLNRLSQCQHAVEWVDSISNSSYGERRQHPTVLALLEPQPSMQRGSWFPTTIGPSYESKFCEACLPERWLAAHKTLLALLQALV